MYRMRKVSAGPRASQKRERGYMALLLKMGDWGGKSGSVWACEKDAEVDIPCARPHASPRDL